jgi:hypothetical protein
MSKHGDSKVSDATAMKIALLNRQVANIVVAIDYDGEGNAVPAIVYCGDQSSVANAIFSDLKEQSDEVDGLFAFENVAFNTMLTSPYPPEDDSGSESESEEGVASESEASEASEKPGDAE